MSKYDYNKTAATGKGFVAAASAGFENALSAADTYNAFEANGSAASCTGGTCRSLRGVNCEAENCKYHHPGGQCSATNITVETPYADNKTDTFCNTFRPNSSC